MAIKIVYPDTSRDKHGRGGWSAKGEGGTLNLDGTGRGPYYRAPAEGSTMPRIGSRVAKAIRSSSRVEQISINDYAVYRGTMAVQNRLANLGYQIDIDGVWGPGTDGTVKDWQGKQGLVADGIYGPATARAMWEPVLAHEVNRRHAFFGFLDSTVVSMLAGHASHESGWDPGAVGYVNPRDLGLYQVNLDAHDDITEKEATDPVSMAAWAFDFVVGNLNYTGWNVNDAIACYNAGRGGAESWVRDGRPEGRIADYVRAVRDKMP